MSQTFAEIHEQHREFVEQQKIFFVGTAAPDGRVSVSPKGMDSLRVMGDLDFWSATGRRTTITKSRSTRMPVEGRGRPNVRTR